MNIPKQPNGSSHDDKMQISRKPISPNSKKVYLHGEIHPEIRVPFREITLSPTKIHNPAPGAPTEEINEPVRVYDTSGPYTDPDIEIDVRKGLNPFRQKWILDRGDVEEYQGRDLRPEDNGYKSPDQMEGLERFDRSNKKVLRAKSGGNLRRETSKT